MSPPGLRARAVDFLRAFSVRLAHRTEPFRWGVALFEPRLPLVWLLNSVWVDTVPEGVTPPSFVDELERLQGGAALGHRHAVIAEEAAGERLAPSLRALGWSGTRHILMASRRLPDRPSHISAVREVDAALAGPFAERSLNLWPEKLPGQAIRELGATKALLAAAGTRFFGTVSGGELTSVCEFCSDGETARIAAVETLPDHRNRGLARAVITHALAEAQATGCDLVFLEAEEEDWPKHLYAKLGFDPIGHLHVLTRTPG